MTDSPPSGPTYPCVWCGAMHHYDCPNLGPVSFIQAVMHDPTVSMRDRMRAAKSLLHLRSKGITSDFVPEQEPEPELTIVIPHQVLQ